MSAYETFWQNNLGLSQPKVAWTHFWTPVLCNTWAKLDPSTSWFNPFGQWRPRGWLVCIQCGFSMFGSFDIILAFGIVEEGGLYPFLVGRITAH